MSARACAGAGELRLTYVERRVVHLVAAGMSNAEIGRELLLSTDTVKSHLYRIGARMGAHGRSGIVGHAIRAGYLTRRAIPGTRRPPVTGRQLEVLGLIARGMETREIGAELFVSENTVKVHVRNLLRAFGVRNRAHLVWRAYQSGVLIVRPRPGLAA